AGESLDAALAAVRRSRPQDDVEVARLQLARGILSNTANDPKAAARSLLAALSVFEKASPKPTAEKASAKFSLAAALIDLGEPALTRKVLASAEADLRALQGPRGSRVGQARLLAGLAALKEGDAGKAAAAFGEAADRAARALGRLVAVQSERE